MKKCISQQKGLTPNGFTLVELAIVLAIIGLLIGGVLRGQELYNNARVTKTITQVNSYNGAMVTFTDTYSAYPGDMGNASTKLPGCQAGNPNSCQNGNNDGMVGTPANVWEGGQQAVTTENTQFWKMLALSHLISGVAPDQATPIWGKSHPASPFIGGYTIITAASGGGAQQMYGSFLIRLHGCIDCANIEGADGVSSDGAGVSPKVASQIDRKMDDGLPGSGSVEASQQGNGGAVDDCETKYNETREDAVCVMSFLLKR